MKKKDEREDERCQRGSLGYRIEKIVLNIYLPEVDIVIDKYIGYHFLKELLYYLVSKVVGHI